MNCNTRNYQAHGGSEWVIGGKLTFLESAEIDGLSRLVSEALTPTENVPLSEATTVASLKETVNALLSALKAAGFMNTEQVINFTIRYRPDVKPGMWVLFQGEKWNISTLGEYSFRKKYLGLKASIAKGVSG